MSINLDFQKNKFLYLILLIISFFFILIFSFSTSPLCHYQGYDSAIFMLVGRAVASGKMMYVDIFDHKGPIMFFLQAVLMKLGGVNLVFTFQVINMFVVLVLIFKLYKMFSLPIKYFSIILIIILPFLGSTFEGGNLTEEYSLPILLICFMLSIKYSLSGKSQHPLVFSFVYGISFALLAFIRLTNAAGLCGIIAAIVIFLIIKGEWKNLFYNIGIFLLGVAIVVLPLCFYFWLNDAFQEMVYATFTFNFKYAATFSNAFGLNIKDFLYLLRIVGPTLFALICLIVYSLNKSNRNLCFSFIVIFVAISTSIALTMGLRTDHYPMLHLLTYSIGAILFVSTISSNINNKMYIFGVSIYIICLTGYFSKRAFSIVEFYKSVNNNSLGYFVDIELVHKLIPFEDRESVFGYNLPSNWYLETNILPPFKFYTSQEIWTRTDSLVYRETNLYLETTPPKWIVIPDSRIVTSTVGVESNIVLKRMIEHDYALQGEDVYHKYYKRKE